MSTILQNATLFYKRNTRGGGIRSFTSRLTGKIDRVLIEFWMGHAIGEEKRAYLRMPTEEMRELYMDAEKLLAIEQTSRNELIERKEKAVKVPEETLAEIEELKATIRGLTKQYDKSTTENLELKSRMSRIELEVTEVRKALEKLLA